MDHADHSHTGQEHIHLDRPADAHHTRHETHDTTIDRSDTNRAASRTMTPLSRTSPAGADAREPLWRELVGQVLRAERVETGRTLQQVADRAGVSPQYLSEVERGRKDPSSEMLETICGALGLRLADLLTASGRTLGSGSPYPHDGRFAVIGPPTGVRPTGIRPTGVRPNNIRPVGVVSLVAA